MKRTLAILATLACALIASGCIVISIHPFYNDDQKIFDNGLIGKWQQENNDAWEFAEEKDDKYLVTIYDDKDVVGLMEGTLFKVGGDTFMDLYPWDFDYAPADSIIPNASDKGLYWNNLHLLPTHSVLRLLKSGADTLKLAMLDKDWLFKQLKANPSFIKHEIPTAISKNVESMDNDENILLSASTQELQAFLAKYGKDEKAFELDTLVKVKK
jgi:hypothetical protein